MIKERVLILGANGFIGSHLADRILKDGYRVRAFDRFSKEVNLNKSSNLEIFKGDFLNEDDIDKALEDISIVIHLISTTNPAISEENPLIDINTNVEGTVKLLQKCAKNVKIKKIIFASSGGTVYGENNTGNPFSEEDKPNPISPYGIGKLTIENYLNYFNKKYNQDYTVFRIANPYGGRQKNTKQQGIIPIIVSNILNSTPINVYGDGSMVRDYIYINDLINIIAESLNVKMKFNTYNIGSGSGLSINQLIEEVENITNKKAIINYKEQPATFVQTSILDNTRIKNELPYIKYTSISEGLKSLIN